MARFLLSPSWRGLAWCGLVLAALPWGMQGLDWPQVVVAQLDNCPELACDFTRHYLPQARRLASGEPGLVQGWYYPPLLAILLAPLTWMASETATALWTGFNLVLALALAALCRTQLKAAGPRLSWGLALALVSLSLPVLHSLKWGQVSLAISVGCIWALVAGGWRGSTLLGVLGAIKVYPLFYGLPLLFRARAGLLAMAGGLALLLGFAVPVVMIGWEQALPFFRPLWSGGPAAGAAGMGGQALAPTLTRWFLDGQHTGLPLDHGALILQLSGWAAVFAEEVLLPAAALLLVLWALRETRTGEHRAPEWAAIWMLALTLSIQPGWHHYFAFLPFAQAVALRRSGPGSRSGGLALVSIALTTLPTLMLEQSLAFQYSAWGGTTLAALLLLPALVSPRAPALSPEASRPWVSWLRLR